MGWEGVGKKADEPGVATRYPPCQGDVYIIDSAQVMASQLMPSRSLILSTVTSHAGLIGMAVSSRKADQLTLDSIATLHVPECS